MTPAFQRDGVSIFQGDCRSVLRSMPADSVQCCVTSPPYFGLRDYGVDGQIGLEATIPEFVAEMVEVFAAVRRVLHPSGTVWMNIGDSYANDGKWGGHTGGKHVAALHCSPIGRNKRYTGLKPKDMCLIPERLFIALQDDGWWVRSKIAWCKKSPMPESVTDRPTNSWEPIALLTRNAKYFYDAEAVKEDDTGRRCNEFRRGTYVNNETFNNSGTLNGSQGEYIDTTGRNMRNVWHLGPEPYPDAHFATFPTEIPRRAIKAGTSEHGCCPACRAPYKRIVDKTKLTRERPNEYTKRTGQEGTGNSCANTVAGVASRTTGWEPTCKCDAGKPVPCRVLDPFFGSGTTGEVAQELGCECWGIELNAEYIELAARRFKQRTFLVGA